MELAIQTRSQRQVVDLTDRFQRVIDDLHIQTGWCFGFVRHTTAALTTADLDPGTDQDYLQAFAAATPAIKYAHPHDPEHFPDHWWASIIGPSIQIPITDGKLALGDWQRVVLFEFAGPRTRRVEVSGQVI